MHELHWKMDFTELKRLLCSLLDEAGFEYTVGNDREQSRDITTPEHLACYFTVVPRPLNRERHSLIPEADSEMIISLIQPCVRWLRIGPCDENGRINSPYVSAEYNVRNVNEVFRNVVSKMFEMQSDAHRDTIQDTVMAKQSIVDMIQAFKPRIAMLKAEISHNIDMTLNAFPGRISKGEAMALCRSELKDLAFMY